MSISVISLGGSVLVPNGPDVRFLFGFRDLIGSVPGRFLIVVGGGSLAREYLDIARRADVPAADLDWIGIRTTHVNAELLRAVLGEEAHGKLACDPGVPLAADRRVAVAGGHIPGRSTDRVAVQFAETLGARLVFNICKAGYVFTADPEDDEKAQPIERMGFGRLLELVGTRWEPGLKAPFDPVAAQAAAEAGIEVAMLGPDLGNLRLALTGQSFRGTVISNRFECNR